MSGARRATNPAAVVLAALALIASGCDWFPGRPRPSERPIAPSQVTSFKALYGDNCAGCHGADGRFGAALPLNNPIYLALVDDTSLRRVIAQGDAGTLMPAFALKAGGNLTDSQITILIRGMRRRWGSMPALGVGAPPYAAGGKGDAEQGAKEFAQYCGSCHGPRARAGSQAGSVVDGAFLSLVNDRYLRTLVIAGRPDLDHPDWRQDVPGHPLSAQEVSDIVAWLAQQRANWEANH